MASLLDSCRVLRKTGQFESAFDLANRTETEARLKGDTSVLIGINRELGILYGVIGKYEESKIRFRHVIRFSSLCEDDVSKAIGFNNLGSTFLNNSEHDSAFVYFHRSMELKKSLGDVKGYAISSINLSSVYKSIGKTKEARTLFDNTLEILLPFEDQGPYYTALVNFAAVNIEDEEYVLADSLLSVVLSQADKKLYFEQYLQALDNYGILLYNQGDYKGAYDSLDVYHEHKEAFISDKTRAHVQELEIKRAKAEK